MPAATVDHSQRICEVWANNLEEELKRIRHVNRKYNYIAMVRDARLTEGKKKKKENCVAHPDFCCA